MRTCRRNWVAMLVACGSLAAGPTPAEEAILELPIRVHVLASEGHKALTATISDDEIRGLIEKVNEIWAPANIRWTIDLIAKGTARNVEDFDRLQEIGFMKDLPFQRRTITSVYPKDDLLRPGWNLFFVADLGVMPVGVYHPETGCMLVAQKNHERPLNPSIVAHELGHSLSLPHRREPYNLMAGGRPGIKPEEKIKLFPEQIKRAREQAEKRRPFEGRRPVESKDEEKP